MADVSPIEDEVDSDPAPPNTEVLNGSANRNDESEEKKSRRPGNTAFKQQRLPAWQPILTAGTVLPMFFLVGIIFIPLGVGFLVTSNKVMEQIVDYTDCMEMNSTGTQLCHEIVANNTGATCSCTVQFNLTEKFMGQVYVYYRMSNYYQNHRRYVNSRDDLKLLGQDPLASSPGCAPYDEYTDPDEINEPIPYAPCGAIANSLYNDTLQLEYQHENGVWEPVELNDKGIAWNSDITAKFQNPSSFDGTLHPPNWQQNITDLEGGYQNEAFVVWMRTAAFPTFRKLHSKVKHAQTTVFDTGLPEGSYKLIVDYNYPVKSFQGTKSLVLSTTSWLGGKNNFLGIAYIVTGSLCILFGALFLCVHVKYGNRGGNFSSTCSLVS